MDKRQDPQHIAKEGLSHYCGDTNPLDHDGYWYNDKNWVSNGYASCIDVCPLPGPDGGRHIIISKLVINKPSGEERLRHAMDSCGYGLQHIGNVHAEIIACKGYYGSEPDCSDWREPSSVSFVIPDNDKKPIENFEKYAKIHNAKVVADETELWDLIWEWVAKHSCE